MQGLYSSMGLYLEELGLRDDETKQLEESLVNEDFSKFSSFQSNSEHFDCIEVLKK